MTDPNGEPCSVCGSLELRLRWQKTAAHRPQIRGSCTRCGRFRLWVPQTDEAKAEADKAEPNSEQPSLF